jgi:hypothetical protein
MRASMPNTCAGAGMGSHQAAAAINARWAVCQDTLYSQATSTTGDGVPTDGR